MKRVNIISALLVLALCLYSLSPKAHSDTAQVAVASNFLLPAKALKASFESHSGHTLQLSFSSSGKHFAQIINGAPFDVFLSADRQKPQQLVEQNFAVATTLAPYAIGQLILWAPKSDLSAKIEIGYLVKSPGLDSATRQQLLIPKALFDAFKAPSSTTQKIAIANARLAPYGYATRQALAAMGLLDQTGRLFVQGENITQTYQFVHSGNTQFGFIAMSQVTPSLSIGKDMWAIPAHLHDPIEQYAVLLNRGEHNLAAKAFLEFLASAPAQEIIHRFGYLAPSSPLVAVGGQL